jgi:hypothetical protein
MLLAMTKQRDAIRQQRCRARRRQGLAVLRIEANEFRLIDALLAAGRISEAESQRRGLVEKATAKLLEDVIARWLPK